MKKYFDPGTQILISGLDIISEHIVWLAKLLAMHHAKDIIHHIHFDENLPDKEFGQFYGPTRSICFNVTAHIAHQLAVVTHENNKFSIKALITMEFLNSILHETFHGMTKNINKNFSITETIEEEEDAENFANTEMWVVAKQFDVEIQSFGPIIDKGLTSFYKELRTASEGDNFQPWQLQQLAMLEKSILYSDTENNIAIKSFFDLSIFFSASSNWDKAEVLPFSERITRETSTPSESVPPSTNSLPNTPFEEFKETSKPQPVTGPEIIQEGYDPLDTEFEIELIAPGPPTSLPNIPSPALSLTNIAGINQPTPSTVTPTVTATNAAGLTGTEKVRAIAEIVLRRLFHHIYTKCDPTPVGTFSNPQGVLDPVSINDIEGASNLFTTMNAHNDMGILTPNMKITEFIKGSVSNQGLPMYKLQMNVGGNLYDRVFIPQNPQKTKQDGSLTTWAKKVQEGNKIAMLLINGGKPTMHIELGAGELLGQEKVKVWNK